jgi:serine/threonine-protein kinase
MNEPHDPNRTVNVSSVPADSLDVGLAAGFGVPRSSLDASQRPVLLKEAKGESDRVVKPSSDAIPDRGETSDRYQLFGEIARGGMGAVLRGRDVDLGRDLAIKVLLEKYATRPEVLRRFIEEAQIGGQLQHPGVVPVYDIGRFGERPFFTMKLVKGQTLQALLSERTDPYTDRPRFLAIALQVCQAMAYAHAKGVIHRDLKPANIMVGAFGEVQVMDWGLAKVLHEGGIADEERASRGRQPPEHGSLIRTTRSSGSAGSFGTDTEAGSLLGTPAYMPPEQANGDVSLLDRRADVFGLGAILCEILTGKPPYVGRSPEEVRRKAANGDLAEALARLDGCGTDAELITLTKGCLAAEVIDRPRDAQAVADGLTAYLDGVQERLHQAELAEAQAKARAIEEARRRRLTLALTATVLLAVTLGGGAWLWLKNERDARTAQTTRDVNEALNQATALREKAKAATSGAAAMLAQAREQIHRALALAQSGPIDVGLVGQVRQLQADLDEEEKDRTLIAALDEARLAQAETLSENRFAVERAVPRFRKAFAAYGLPAGQGEPRVAALRIRQRPAAVQEAILAALDEWDDLAGKPRLRIDEPHRKWLRAVLEAAEPDDAWTGKVRNARRETDPARRQAALEALAKSVDVEKVPIRALTRLLAASGRPGGGYPLRPAQAVELLRRAQRRYPADFWVNEHLGQTLRELTPPQWDEAVRFHTAAVALRPDSPGALVNLGAALHGNGKLDEAIGCYRKAIALDPKYTLAHLNLGNVLKTKGQREEAIACFEKVIKLDPKHAGAHNSLGVALIGVGRVDEGIAHFRTVIASDPDDAGAHNNLGSALKGKGQLDEAIACFKKAIKLDPKYAQAHSNLGHALKARGKLDEAIKCYRKAIELDPMDANLHNNLGSALNDRGKVDEAIACYRRAIEIDPRFADAHNSLAIALHGKGKEEEAVACWRQAIELDPKNAKVYANLGTVLAGKGQLDEAIAYFRKAIALDPKLIETHGKLGNALRARGEVEEAIACFRKLIALDPKDTGAHINLGSALLDREKVDEAIACFRKVIELDPKYAQAHYNLGNALRRKDRVEEAITSFKKAIEIDPKYAEAHCNLGSALTHQGHFAEALAAYRRGHELGTKRPDWRYPSIQWVREAERLAALEAKLAAFLKGEHKFKDTAERLGLAGVCQAKKLHHAATRLYADAFAADANLVGDATTALRYRAARQAALAGAGKGADAGNFDDQERARLRKQALDWLRADLTLLATGEVGRSRVARILGHWQKDSDLAAIRDAAALAKLSTDEQKAFTQLWSDVAELLKKAETPAKKEGER